MTDTVLAYQRRRLADHARIDLLALDLPPTSFSTQALWFELDPQALADLCHSSRCSAPCTRPSTPR